MPLTDTLLKNCYGMTPLFQDRDPHWSIAQQFLKKNYKDDSKHQIALVVYADRDGQLFDHDSDIGCGIGAYSLSLAMGIPILDLTTI